MASKNVAAADVLGGRNRPLELYSTRGPAWPKGKVRDEMAKLRTLDGYALGEERCPFCRQRFAMKDDLERALREEWERARAADALEVIIVGVTLQHILKNASGGTMCATLPPIPSPTS